MSRAFQFQHLQNRTVHRFVASNQADPTQRRHFSLAAYGLPAPGLRLTPVVTDSQPKTWYGMGWVGPFAVALSATSEPDDHRLATLGEPGQTPPCRKAARRESWTPKAARRAPLARERTLKRPMAIWTRFTMYGSRRLGHRERVDVPQRCHQNGCNATTSSSHAFPHHQRPSRPTLGALAPAGGGRPAQPQP